MKKLSEDFYKALNNVPEGQEAIPYITPTDKDNFKEEVLSKNVYRVTLDKSTIIVEIRKNKGNVAITYHWGTLENDYYWAKLMGYVMFKIVMRDGNG